MDLPDEIGQLPRGYRFLAIFGSVTSIVAVIMTLWLQRHANELQKGENTIAIIAAGAAADVRTSRFELARLERTDHLSTRQALNAVKGIAAVFRHLELVAICYNQALCLPDPLLDHVCPDIALLVSVSTDGPLTALPEPLVRDEMALSVLVKHCEERT